MALDGDPSAAASKPAEKQTVTRADLAGSIYRKIGLSRAESAAIVEMVISEIVEALASREIVKLSSFGTFALREKSERLGRNPRTGADARITARWVIVFRPSNILRARINGRDADDAPSADRASSSTSGA